MRTYKFMKRNNIIFLLVLLLSVAACSFTTKKIDPGDNDKDKVLSELVSFVLENYHYSPKEMDADFSRSVYEEYLKSLDPRKRFFLKSDIEEFEKYKEELSNQLKSHNVDFFNLTYERMQKRIEEMEEVYKEILDKPFNFDSDEEINTDYDNLDFAANKDERNAIWRKQLKFNVLSTFFDLKKEEEEKSKKAEEDTESKEEYVAKSDEELEAEARKSVKQSLDQFYDINKDLTKEDWISVYLNTVANQFRSEEHTSELQSRGHLVCRLLLEKKKQ